jgi:putative hydrolase of the HAD superfamily
MVKAIIFDCFGVLVGTGFWSVYRQLGGNPDQDAEYIATMLESSNSSRMPMLEFQRAMAQHLGVSLDQFMSAFSNDERPNQPIFDYIASQLKPHYKIGIISNANVGVIEQRIPPSLLQLFDSVVVSAKVGLLKPDPAIFSLAAAQLGVDPTEIVFTDDYFEYLPGAKAVGMQTILYKDFTDFTHQLARLTSEKTTPDPAE